ncbi:uncharacterized protein LOC117896941 [Drosophila subobscura]|uniref:uncharacterized protein LOC117896941 n=1 Tax=Drosophila subobscura TaxID=7241 RepID=UPI00155AC397|nr:uncharacterized protein LOC117896941 [Drosophila subobscura]
MFFKTSTLLLALVALAAAAPISGIAPSASLIDFMMNSKSLRTATTLNMHCFDWYLPILKGHSDQYEENYKICSEKFNAAKWLTDTSYGIARNGITSKAKETCDALMRCEYEKENTKAFECYSKTAPEQSVILNTIGNNATDLNKQLIAELALIDFDLDVCQTTAERVYKEDSADSFEELNACLENDNWSQPTTTVSN